MDTKTQDFIAIPPPSWATATEMLLAVLLNGSAKGREEAMAELRKMAKVADITVDMRAALVLVDQSGPMANADPNTWQIVHATLNA